MVPGPETLVGPWDPTGLGLTPASRPHHTAGTASLWIGDELVLANETASSPVTLDPVSAIVFSTLDGNQTVEELVEDLQLALGGTLEERNTQMSWLLGSLALHGVVHWRGCTAALVPRRLLLQPDPDSCIGQSIGLGDGELLQTRDSAGDIVRFGSTRIELLEPLLVEIETEPVDDGPTELTFLRASISQQRHKRRQYIVDGAGNRLWASWDPDSAVETFTRMIRSLLDPWDAPRIEALALRGEAGLLLVHPSLREPALDALRSTSRADPDLLVPSLGYRLTSASGLEATGGEARPDRIAAVVVPRTRSQQHRLRLLLHLAQRWDDRHLAAIAELAETVALVEVDHHLSLESLRTLLLDSAHSMGASSPAGGG